MNTNPVVIITGAANGIGRATAMAFARKQYALALTDADADGLKNLAHDLAQLKTDYMVLAADLADPASWPSVVAQTMDRWGRVDVLINNAAWRTMETMRTMSVETWEKTVRICLTAPAFLARHAAAAMEKNGSTGLILNVSSVMSSRAGGTSPAYVACKGGIDSLTYELAALYGPRGIRSVAIRPGNVETSLSNTYKDDKGNNISAQLVDHMHDQTPLGRSASPDEIAQVAVWLAGPEASFINGTTICVDGGFSHNFHSYQMKKLQNPKEF